MGTHKVTYTPETDAQASPVFGKHSCATVLADFARKLERERDEAREIIRMAKAKFCEEGSDGNVASEMFSILNG
jgi:hypothetical protein